MNGEVIKINYPILKKCPQCDTNLNEIYYHRVQCPNCNYVQQQLGLSVRGSFTMPFIITTIAVGAAITLIILLSENKKESV